MDVALISGIINTLTLLCFHFHSKADSLITMSQTLEKEQIYTKILNDFMQAFEMPAVPYVHIPCGDEKSTLEGISAELDMLKRWKRTREKQRQLFSLYRIGRLIKDYEDSVLRREGLQTNRKIINNKIRRQYSGESVKNITLAVNLFNTLGEFVDYFVCLKETSARDFSRLSEDYRDGLMYALRHVK
jgi:hypothetical protein